MRIVDRALSRIESALANARKRSGVLDHAWRALERFNDVDADRLAAAISYYGFFAAFSLAMAICRSSCLHRSTLGSLTSCFFACRRFLKIVVLRFERGNSVIVFALP